MRSIAVTYSVRIPGGYDEKDVTVQIPISTKNLHALHRGENDIEHSLIEPALVVIEQLCGRIYIPYSIDKIWEVAEDE